MGIGKMVKKEVEEARKEILKSFQLMHIHHGKYAYIIMNGLFTLTEPIRSDAM